MKKFKKLLSILMVSAMLMSIMTFTVSAATTYTPVQGGTTTFNKYLILEDGATVPNKTFTFSIAPGSAIPADSTHMAVLAGPTATNAPSVGSATFTQNSTINTDSASSPVTGVANANYAAVTGITVDFSGVTFPEPGVYRYTLTETAESAPYTITSTNPLTLDVYITDDGTGHLVVDSYVLHTSTDAPLKGTDNGSADVSNEDDPVSDKKDGFVNSYSTNNITASKTVSGNQASRDKYFQITVTVPNLTAADSFTVTRTNCDSAPTQNAATTYSSMSNPATVTGSDLATGVNFYLQDGQSIVINGLPAGASYTVTEAPEDYKPSLSVTGDTNNSATTITTSTTGTLNDDIIAAFTNTRDGVIPTGVLLKIAPFAVGILLFGAMIIFTVSKRRREAY